MINVHQTTATDLKTAIANTKKLAILTALFITPVAASLAAMSMPQVYANPALAAGITVSPEALKAVINTIGSGSRSDVLEVDKNTNFMLNNVSSDRARGGFAVTSHSRVAPNSYDVFGAKSKEIATGTEGSVTSVMMLDREGD